MLTGLENRYFRSLYYYKFESVSTIPSPRNIIAYRKKRSFGAGFSI